METFLAIACAYCAGIYLPLIILKVWEPDRYAFWPWPVNLGIMLGMLAVAVVAGVST